MIILLILVKNIKFFYTKEVRYLTIFFIPLINAFINNDQYVFNSSIKYLRFYFFV